MSETNGGSKESRKMVDELLAVVNAMNEHEKQCDKFEIAPKKNRVLASSLLSSGPAAFMLHNAQPP